MSFSPNCQLPSSICLFFFILQYLQEADFQILSRAYIVRYIVGLLLVDSKKVYGQKKKWLGISELVVKGSFIFIPCNKTFSNSLHQSYFVSLLRKLIFCIYEALLMGLLYLILTTPLWGRWLYYSHFIDEKIEQEKLSHLSKSLCIDGIQTGCSLHSLFSFLIWL